MNKIETNLDANIILLLIYFYFFVKKFIYLVLVWCFWSKTKKSFGSLIAQKIFIKVVGFLCYCIIILIVSRFWLLVISTK